MLQTKHMHRIKTFRKSINLLAWEDRYRSARLQDLEEFYTDLLLLRIEKVRLTIL